MGFCPVLNSELVKILSFVSCEIEKIRTTIQVNENESPASIGITFVELAVFDFSLLAGITSAQPEMKTGRLVSWSMITTPIRMTITTSLKCQAP